MPQAPLLRRRPQTGRGRILQTESNADGSFPPQWQWRPEGETCPSREHGGPGPRPRLPGHRNTRGEWEPTASCCGGPGSRSGTGPWPPRQGCTGPGEPGPRPQEAPGARPAPAARSAGCTAVRGLRRLPRALGGDKGRGTGDGGDGPELSRVPHTRACAWCQVGPREPLRNRASVRWCLETQNGGPRRQGRPHPCPLSCLAPHPKVSGLLPRHLGSDLGHSLEPGRPYFGEHEPSIPER